MLADGLQRGVWPIDPAAWPDASGQASGARAAEAGAEAGVEAGVEAEAVETMDLRSFGNRYALVAALHHWLAEAATSIGAGDSGSGGGGGGVAPCTSGHLAPASCVSSRLTPASHSPSLGSGGGTTCEWPKCP